MFGERHPAEEVASKGFVGFWSKNASKSDTQEPRGEEGWRRFPANDNVAIIRGVQTTVEATEDGQPTTKPRLDCLNCGTSENTGKNTWETLSVLRIFSYGKWPEKQTYSALDYCQEIFSDNAKYSTAISQVVFPVFSDLENTPVPTVYIAVMLGGPVLLGRWFLLLLTAREVRDGYSFVVDSHLLWSCWLVTHAIDRFGCHRQWREHRSPAWWPLFFAKRSSLWLAQASYMTFFLVFVIPMLMVLVMEMYVLLPIKLVYDPELPPGFEAPQRMNEGIQRINRNGWSRPDPMTATKEVIDPTVGGLLAVLAFPAGMSWMFRLLTNYRITNRALFVSIYPGVFTGVGVVRGMLGLRNAYLKWPQTVQEKEFLVEMRLRNLEPEETMEESVEKKEEQEQEQEEVAVGDLPVLDLIENQSDRESDNGEERFLL
ncbi:hypothetical protein BDM02DRAFT_3132426 [Thelephora ganbajun]|uniref:Uncharacterized protein n=1 Tax=Thelephora ganbajun TaxID=370292 RepID=A0ACB6Z1H2_THEGA|nr:hypothetical protein BDM02DRAFT_3132426 [Thelephora ganbajun]